jgi:hypothetical protein
MTAPIGAKAHRLRIAAMALEQIAGDRGEANDDRAAAADAAAELRRRLLAAGWDYPAAVR